MSRWLFILAMCTALLLVAATAQATSITYHVNGTLDYQDSGSDPLSLDGATYSLQMAFDTADNDGTGIYLGTSSTLTLGATAYSGTAALGIIDPTTLLLNDTFFVASATPLSVLHIIEFGAGFLSPPALPYYNTGDVADIFSLVEYVADVAGNPNAEFFFDLINAETYSVPSRDPGGQEPIPEPASLTCFGIGLIGLGIFRARKKARR